MSEIKFYDLVPVIGEVYMMEFKGAGTAQSGWRPGVVLQNNIGNANSPNIIALPLTSSIKKVDQPTHVVVPAAETNLWKDSMVLCENPETIAKGSIGRYMTTLPEKYMKKIAIASCIATTAIAYLTADDLINVWQTAIRINNKTIRTVNAYNM